MAEPAHIDCKALIRRFGGPASLYRRLVRRGHSMSFKSVEKWRERDRIQTPWLAEMLIMAKEDGYPINLMDYISRTEQVAPTVPDEKEDEEDSLI